MKVHLTESQIHTILRNLTKLDDVNVEGFDDWKRDKVNDKKCERIRKRLHEALYQHRKKSTKN
tara:strand:- start:476 stop:664 length:189 start_codon:yes stop_codon:yes gene_type:complete